MYIRKLIAHGVHSTCDHGWRGHTRRVAKANTTHAIGMIGPNNLQNVFNRYVAFERTAKSCGHATVHLDSPLLGNWHNLREVGNRFINGLVQVGFAMAFTRRDKAHHHVRLGGSGTLCTTCIGHEHGDFRARLAAYLC